MTQVTLEGIGEVRRALKVIDQKLPVELGHMMERAAVPVVAAARSRAPHRSGALSRSLKVTAQSSAVSIRSALPYANVIHWGGTTGRGHRPGVGGSGSVTIKANRFIWDVGEARMEDFAQRLVVELDRFFGHYGFK